MNADRLYAPRTIGSEPWATHRELQFRLMKQMARLDPEKFGNVTERQLIPLRNRRGMGVVTLAMQEIVRRYGEEPASA